MNEGGDGPRVLFLFRHGETDWNREGRLQGHTDTPLNATGFVQAEELGEALRQHRLDAIVSSDLQRALTTARIAAEALSVPLFTEPLLRETNVGEAEGLLWAEAKARFGEELSERWYADDDVAFPGGESGLMTRTRGLSGLRRFVAGAALSADRSLDPWRHGPAIGQTRPATGQPAGQGAQHRDLHPRLRPGDRAALHASRRRTAVRR